MQRAREFFENEHAARDVHICVLFLINFFFILPLPSIT